MLQVHNEFVPLGVGLETEIAENLVQPGSLLVAENSYQDHLGQRSTRAGSRILSASNQATRPSGGTLPTVWKFGSLNRNLIRFNEAPVPMHVWDDTANVWNRPNDSTFTSWRMGPITTIAAPVIGGVRAGENVAVVDTATYLDRGIIAYEHTSTAGVKTARLAVTDRDSNTIIYSRTLPTGTLRPRVIVSGDSFCLVYNAGGTLKIDVYSAVGFTFSTITGGSCDADSVIDVRLGGFDADADISVLYQLLTAPGYTAIRCSEVDIAGVAIVSDYLITTATAPVSGQADSNLALAWMQDGAATGTVAVIACSTSYGLYVINSIPAPTAGTSSGTLQQLDTTATTAPVTTTEGVRNVVGTTTVGSVYRVLYEFVAPSLPARSVIKSALWTGSSTKTTPYRGCGLASKLWKGPDGNYYFLAVQDQLEQRTYFVFQFGNALTTYWATPQAVAYVRSAAGLTSKASHLPSVATDSDGNFVVSVLYETRTEETAPSGVADGQDEVAEMAISLLTITHRQSPDTDFGNPVEFAGSLFVPGGTLQAFDGTCYGLAGFAAFPPEMGSTVSGTGGLEPDAQYGWVCCYSYVDRQGRKWRSAPSVVHTDATVGSDTAVTISADTLRIVDRPDYQIEFYRTFANAPGSYFLVASVPNDPTADSVSVLDKVADADLGEELYTDGNSLENQATPAASHVCVYQNRLFMAEDGTGTLWYSLPLDLTHGLTFNETLTKDVGDPSDPITGLAVYGTALIVFKRNSTWTLYGEGADALGRGQTYVDNRIDPEIGCTNAASILPSKDAVYFKAPGERAGFYVAATGGVSYVGQGVRNYTDLTVTGACYVPRVAEYRFPTSEGRTLVLSAITKHWSTNTEQECLAATSSYSGCDGMVYANGDGQVMAEDSTVFAEGSTGYVHKLRSPWLDIGGMEGWERVRKILGTGLPGGRHSLTVKVFGEDDSVIGQWIQQFDGTEDEWKWTLRLIKQKVSALSVQFEIGIYQPTVIDPDDPVVATAGPFINGFNMEVGVKKGTRKMGAANKPQPVTP